MKKWIQFFALFLISTICFGQFSINQDTIKTLNQEEVKFILKNAPAFSIYKDNYFITGAKLGETPTRDNTDVKFQFSFKQRLSNKPIAKKVYAYLTYTQKSFWDIYKDSRPFSETNYNPGLLMVKPTFKNNKFNGALTLSFEHESNGKDSIYSRSWNYLSVGYGHIFSPKFVAGVRLWIPFVGSENPDLIEYVGYGEGQMQWVILKNKLHLNLIVRKGASWDWKGSMQTSISYLPFPNKTIGLMMQWWQGYAESLIDYNERRGMLRIGIQFSPTYYRFY